MEPPVTSMLPRRTSQLKNRGRKPQQSRWRTRDSNEIFRQTCINFYKTILRHVRLVTFCSFQFAHCAKQQRETTNRVVKWWRHKNWTWEKMGYAAILGKSMMKHVESPKVPCLLQFLAEMWALLGRILSIQNLLICIGSFSLDPAQN